MMQVHLFGATSSPSCACFTLQRTAEDHKDEFDEETVKTVDKNFYVDDCLKSTSSVEKAKRLATQLLEILAKGGFRGKSKCGSMVLNSCMRKMICGQTCPKRLKK